MVKACSVQISLPADLLAEIDKSREARKHGRSAVIQQSIRLYLDLQKRREVDAEYARAYSGKADEVFEELAVFLRGQEWPET